MPRSRRQTARSVAERDVVLEPLQGAVTREADIDTALQLSDAFGQDEATRRLDHREMR